MWFATETGRTLYALSGGLDRSDWVRNLVADPEVRVRVGRMDGEATARVLEAGTDEDALARRLLVEKYQRAGHDDLVDWGRTALAVAFDLGDAARPVRTRSRGWRPGPTRSDPSAPPSPPGDRGR